MYHIKLLLKNRVRPVRRKTADSVSFVQVGGLHSPFALRHPPPQGKDLLAGGMHLRRHGYRFRPLSCSAPFAAEERT
jgi:hypothetical protein